MLSFFKKYLNELNVFNCLFQLARYSNLLRQRAKRNYCIGSFYLVYFNLNDFSNM